MSNKFNWSSVDIAATLIQDLKIEATDARTIAHYLVSGNKVLAGESAVIGWHEGKLLATLLGPGTDDGGNFDVKVPLSMKSTAAFLTFGGTDNGGPMDQYRPPIAITGLGKGGGTDDGGAHREPPSTGGFKVGE